jgi:hypothetical protein
VPADVFEDDHCDTAGTRPGSIADDGDQDRTGSLLVDRNDVPWTLAEVMDLR